MMPVPICRPRFYQPCRPDWRPARREKATLPSMHASAGSTAYGPKASSTKRSGFVTAMRFFESA